LKPCPSLAPSLPLLKFYLGLAMCTHRFINLLLPILYRKNPHFYTVKTPLTIPVLKRIYNIARN
jgi:hypothetical protein